MELCVKTYNCARVHVGYYVGGGTNEDERSIDCGFGVIEGSVVTKRLRPVKVRWTTSEGQTSILQTLVIYPKTDMAIITISNSKGTRTIRLVKKKEGKRSTIYKSSL